MSGKKINRRQFCKGALGVGATAMSLPAGIVRGYASGPRRVPADVAMVSAGTPQEGMALAVDMIDGMNFVTAGSTVLVKPSINSANPFPFTTSPASVVWTVERLYQEGAGHVIVADQSFYLDSTEDNMKSTGVYDAAVGAGAEVVYLETRSWLAVENPGAGTWKGVFHLSDILADVDHVVNLPRISTHSIAAFTIALKNWVGVLLPADRQKMHSLYAAKVDHCIAELSLGVMADLVLIDADLINTREGPNIGEVASPGVFMAARDPVANDVAALALMKSIILAEGVGDCEGRDPILCDPEKSIWGFWQIWRAVELGIGATGPAEINLLTNSAEPDGLDPTLEADIFDEIANFQGPDSPWACFVGTALRK